MAAKTGSIYISASRQDSNAVPTANTPFSGSRNSAELLGILLDVTGSRILKMAATKSEVLISQPLDKIATPFQRLTPHFPGSTNLEALLRIPPDATGSRILKMAATKPEVLISQPLDKIATPFQRLTPIFVFQKVNGATTNNALCNRKSDIEYGGR